MIYFIQDTHSRAIKIGTSKSPIKRLASLQTAHGSKLVLVGVMDGGEQEERVLHQQFTRKRGEWFEPTRELLTFIHENAVLRSALAEVRLPRTRGQSAFDQYGFKSELRGNDLFSSLARVIVACKMDIDTAFETVYSDGWKRLYPNMSKDAMRQEIQRLVDIQNNPQPTP